MSFRHDTATLERNQHLQQQKLEMSFRHSYRLHWLSLSTIVEIRNVFQTLRQLKKTVILSTIVEIRNVFQTQDTGQREVVSTIVEIRNVFQTLFPNLHLSYYLQQQKLEMSFRRLTAEAVRDFIYNSRNQKCLLDWKIARWWFV